MLPHDGASAGHEADGVGAKSPSCSIPNDGRYSIYIEVQDGIVAKEAKAAATKAVGLAAADTAVVEAAADSPCGLATRTTRT